MRAHLKETVILIVVLSAVLFPAYVPAGKTLVLGDDCEPPLSNENATGIVNMVLKEAFARIGMEVKFDRLQSERSLQNANKGLIDGDSIRISGLEAIYPNLVRVPEKVVDFDFVPYIHAGGIKINDWKDLDKHCIGIVKGWKMLEENVKAECLIKVENPEMLFRMLFLKRIDIGVVDRIEGDYILNKLGFRNILRGETTLARREMFLYLHKTHRELVEPVVRALLQMKKDGTYAKLAGSSK